MRMTLGKGANTTVVPTAVDTSAHEQLNALYARLRDNPFSDSDSVRITIIGTMVYLLAQRLNVPPLYK